MKVSKEVAKPIPPPVEYHLVLSEEEYEVLKAAVAVANFSEVRRALEQRSSVHVDRSDDLMYKMHNTFYDWKG